MQPEDGEVVWVLDREAAGQLKSIAKIAKIAKSAKIAD